jgi:hypothetical protein
MTRLPHDHIEISERIQHELRTRGHDDVPAVEAARWLDHAHMLTDSRSRPGLPLRNLLRADRIKGAEQRPPQRYGRWFIRQLET